MHFNDLWLSAQVVPVLTFYSHHCQHLIKQREIFKDLGSAGTVIKIKCLAFELKGEHYIDLNLYFDSL